MDFEKRPRVLSECTQPLYHGVHLFRGHFLQTFPLLLKRVFFGGIPTGGFLFLKIPGKIGKNQLSPSVFPAGSGGNPVSSALPCPLHPSRVLHTNPSFVILAFEEKHPSSLHNLYKRSIGRNGDLRNFFRDFGFPKGFRKCRVPRCVREAPLHALPPLLKKLNPSNKEKGSEAPENRAFGTLRNLKGFLSKGGDMPEDPGLGYRRGMNPAASTSCCPEGLRRKSMKALTSPLGSPLVYM